MEQPPAPPPPLHSVVILMGATAVGKTRLAIDLALKLSGEVVNADSMQVYRSLNVMVAKASLAERRDVPHHCMDVLPVTDVRFNASRFVELASAAIDDIIARNKLPIVVGGSHQYLEALLWRNYCSSSSSSEKAFPHLEFDDSALASAILKRYSSTASDAAVAAIVPSFDADSNNNNTLSPYEVLKLVDPLTANKLRSTEDRKIRRALEHFYHTDRPMSEAILAQKMALRYSPCVLWLDTEKEALYARLDRRVDTMLAGGLLAEAEAIRGEFLSAGMALDFTKGALQAIGFRELEPYFTADVRTEALLAQCVATMKTRSRNYARTQLKWVKHHFRTRLPVFRTDTTDPSTWESTVLAPALSICEDFRLGRAYRIAALPVLQPKAEVRLDQWRKYSCDACQRELNGQAEWDAHVKSKGANASTCPVVNNRGSRVTMQHTRQIERSSSSSKVHRKRYARCRRLQEAAASLNPTQGAPPINQVKVVRVVRIVRRLLWLLLARRRRRFSCAFARANQDHIGYAPLKWRWWRRHAWRLLLLRRRPAGGVGHDRYDE